MMQERSVTLYADPGERRASNLGTVFLHPVLACTRAFLLPHARRSLLLQQPVFLRPPLGDRHAGRPQPEHHAVLYPQRRDGADARQRQSARRLRTGRAVRLPRALPLRRLGRPRILVAAVQRTEHARVLPPHPSGARRPAGLYALGRQRDRAAARQHLHRLRRRRAPRRGAALADAPPHTRPAAARRHLSGSRRQRPHRRGHPLHEPPSVRGAERAGGRRLDFSEPFALFAPVQGQNRLFSL